MQVLHEGLIPCSKIYKVCHLNSYNNDVSVLNEIIDKGIRILKDNPNSLPFITKYADKKIVTTFLLSVIGGYRPEYMLLSFYDENMDLVGASLVSRGRPWYAPTGIQVINEECTVAFKRGVGLSRALAFSVERLAIKNDVKLILFSNANLPCKKMLENTFEKHLGYSSYKTFYKELI